MNDRHNNVRKTLRGMETTNWRAGFGAAVRGQLHIIYIFTYPRSIELPQITFVCCLVSFPPLMLTLSFEGVFSRAFALRTGLECVLP